eukprot:8800838-Lingulodinium_polyedra.AAC.1
MQRQSSRGPTKCTTTEALPGPATMPMLPCSKHASEAEKPMNAAGTSEPTLDEQKPHCWRPVQRPEHATPMP